MSLPPIRLLVVDDDPRVRQAVEKTVALEENMLLAGEAADASTAWSVAEQCMPTVALIDVLLPDEIRGLALIGRLSHRPGCAVVAMSVRSGLREPARAAGAVAFVEKGGDIEALLHAVRTAAPRLA
jgi:DNA-binding NarL/FixJ family response regulator